MADHGTGGGEGEVVDHPGDRGEQMAVEETDQMVAEPARVEGAVLIDGGDGLQGRDQEAAGGENPRVVEGEPHARDQAGAVGSSGEPENSGMVAEGPPMVERGSGDAEGSEEHVEEVHIEEVQTTEADPIEVRAEDVTFRPTAGAATSSRHVPITYADIAEHAPDELLAKLLEDHPVIGEYMLKAKEDRARAIEAAEAAARAEREAERESAREGLAVDVEAEEALGPRVSVVAEAGALERPEFSEETYTPPRPHLFVPLGFAGYKPP
ncbi:hypothetical protein RHMOL_Rhmol01G0146300 [Rhododendron molle]|uniref:Uncharacterized protein n=1 Tax=Rhododendron molle TaxID=49168 RepID=A0ACC0Q1E1_RHOML|nr:hypothetical protein RHMOL_Rhmol01G0146300 [Rhododendron molle]